MRIRTALVLPASLDLHRAPCTCAPHRKALPHVELDNVRKDGLRTALSPSFVIQKRDLAKDYECKVQTSETLIELAAIRLLLRGLAAAHKACLATSA